MGHKKRGRPKSLDERTAPLTVVTGGAVTSSSASPGALSQLSPFHLNAEAAFENQKLFEGMEEGTGSFSPELGSIAKSKPQPKYRTKYKKDDMEYQASTVDDDELIQEYEI